MKQKSYDIQLTDNFRLSEFLQSDTADRKKFSEQYMVTYEIVDNIHTLCRNVLQPLREQVGKIIVTSGYRCNRLNKEIKGSETSQHLTGQAADIIPQDFSKAIEVIKTLEFDQLVIYQNFLHVSYRTLQLRKQILYR